MNVTYLKICFITTAAIFNGKFTESFVVINNVVGIVAMIDFWYIFSDYLN